MGQSHNPARSARRKAEVLEHLEAEQTRCHYCGNTDPLVLRRYRIEAHHIFGRKRDPLEVTVCLNCHAAATEGLRDADVPMVSEQEPTMFARSVFRTLAVHFSLLAKACWRFAQRMEKS